MKLTRTFTLKNQDNLTLTIFHHAELDLHDLSHGGYLNVSTNIAYVDSMTFRLFENPSVDVQKNAFEKLVRLPKGAGVWVNGELISFPDSVPMSVGLNA